MPPINLVQAIYFPSHRDTEYEASKSYEIVHGINKTFVKLYHDPFNQGNASHIGWLLTDIAVDFLTSARHAPDVNILNHICPVGVEVSVVLLSEALQKVLILVEIRLGLKLLARLEHLNNVYIMAYTLIAITYPPFFI